MKTYNTGINGTIPLGYEYITGKGKKELFLTVVEFAPFLDHMNISGSNITLCRDYFTHKPTGTTRILVESTL